MKHALVCASKPRATTGTTWEKIKTASRQAVDALVDEQISVKHAVEQDTTGSMIQDKDET